MTDWPMWVYGHLPPGAQDALVTLRGYQLAYHRRGGSYRRYVSDLMRSQWLSSEALREMQATLLRDLLAEAFAGTRFYRGTLSRWKDRIDTFTLEELPELPIVEPRQLRVDVDAFVNYPRVRKYGAFVGRTSGTTGSPLRWPYDWDSIRRGLALRERQYRWAGITGNETSIRFSGRVLLGRNKGGRYWRYNAAERQWFYCVYSMTEQSLPQYYEQLKRISPQYLDGYPSAICRLARWINSQGLAGQCRLWAVISTAETLDNVQREEIERAFGCKVFDYYSSSDGAPYITECAAGGKHINPESGIVEVLRDDGAPARAGEVGALVVTSFHQRAMPLIRYRIGDTARIGAGRSCPCGRAMPLVEQVEGRERDCLRTRSGRLLGAPCVAGTMLTLSGRIAASQIEQSSMDRFVFRYVPLGARLSESELSTFVGRLENELGTSPEVTVQVVPELPLSAQGKTRLVIGLEPTQAAMIGAGPEEPA